MFDLLYFNGEPLVRKSFAERRAVLREHFKEHEGEWFFAKSLDTTVMEEVEEFLEESIKGKKSKHILFVSVSVVFIGAQVTAKGLW